MNKLKRLKLKMDTQRRSNWTKSVGLELISSGEDKSKNYLYGKGYRCNSEGRHMRQITSVYRSRGRDSGGSEEERVEE